MATDNTITGVLLDVVFYMDMILKFCLFFFLSVDINRVEILHGLPFEFKLGNWLPHGIL